MSSLRNSLHRRNHKERSQLAHRARLGILEKHKDYVLRARDYHSKQDRLNRLRQKAAERNKDEFYFGMNRERTQGGVHIQDRGNTSLPEDIVKVLKTQDENYLRTMRTAGLKKIEKLKSQLTAIADLLQPSSLNNESDDLDGGLDDTELQVLREAGVIPPAVPKRRRRSSGVIPRKHVVFAENDEQARELAASSRKGAQSEQENKMDVAEDDSLELGWKAPEEERKRRKGRGRAQRESDSDAALDKQAAEEERREAVAQHRTRLLKELSARLFRDRQLRYAERELEMQKLIMGKGGKKKLKGLEKVEGQEDEDEDNDFDTQTPKKKVDEKTWKPRVYKWRVERKK